jgi:oligoendopeptidase F
MLPADTISVFRSKIMVKTRNETAIEDKWNIEALFSSPEEWNKEFAESAPPQSPRFPTLTQFKNTLAEGPHQVRKFLDLFFETDRKLSKLFTYAHMKHDEEITDPKSKAAFIEAQGAFHAFHEEMAWFEPELLALPQTQIEEYLRSPELADYRFYLEKIFRLKPYTLSQEQERLMAMAAKALTAPYKAFRSLNDADLKFPKVLDQDGKEHELTHAAYALHLRSRDRILRKNAFTTYHQSFKSCQNTLCELLSGQIETHVFNAKVRGFKSSLDAFLFPNNIHPNVYHSLISAVHGEIDALHRYLQIRSQVLKIAPLHLYDLQVPLVENFDLEIPFGKAEDLIIESVKPLGSEYQNLLHQGLKSNRWVDRYENQFKRSGAYSSGCYDSMPYILMNYKNIIRDVFTLAHEAGHSMHSHFSHTSQPYVYSRYPIFLAEVASTFNEELLLQTMLKNAQSREEKIFLLTQKIEDMRATLFRQTQFAEFELWLHTQAEKNIPLTPESLNQEYLKMNAFYYGKDVASDPEIANEWSRIPHFYYNFYVYQYATGISAALALAARVLRGGVQEREQYLGLLKSGDSLYPIDALQRAGVNMLTGDAVKQAIAHFRSLLDELEQLISAKT